jgi:hypothetical protein
VAYFDSGRFSRVIGTFLEGSSQNANAFMLDIGVKSLEDTLTEYALSIIVHVDDG